MSRPVENMSLRDLITETERLSRELNQHLDQGVLPKLQNVERLLSPSGEDAAEVLDVTVRNHVAALLETDQFTQQKFQKLEEFLAGLDSQIEALRNRS